MTSSSRSGAPPDTEQKEKARQCILKGAEAIKSNKLDDGEKWFKASLQHVPDYPVALINLATVALHRGRVDDATTFAERAVKAQTSVQALSILAEAYRAANRIQDALNILQEIIRLDPSQGTALQGIASILESSGDISAAKKYYRKAVKVDPENVAATIKYCDLAWRDDHDSVVRLQEGLYERVRTIPHKAIQILQSLVVYKEWVERIKRGLLPYHATSLDQLFFKYGLSYLQDIDRQSTILLDNDPQNVMALTAKATASFCLGDAAVAQEHYEKAAPSLPNHIIQSIRFDQPFFEHLENFVEDDLFSGLPKVDTVRLMKSKPEHVLYLSCNAPYFGSFAIPMIRSLNDRGADAAVHIHLMDTSDADLNAANLFCDGLTNVTAAITSEQPGLTRAPMIESRCYYHAIRFIRFYQCLQKSQSTLWLSDVDAIVNRNLDNLYPLLGNSDVGMRVRPGRLEPWNQFNACLVAAKPSASSVTYFRLIAAYIKHFWDSRELRWGIDQLAMYAVYDYLKQFGRAPDLSFFDDKVLDYEYSADGFLWCCSGREKFLIQRKVSRDEAIQESDDRPTRYLRAYRKYASEIVD